MDFPKSLESAVKAYIHDPFWNARIISGGHINRTFLVEAVDPYILQCLNPDLYGGEMKTLENNYLRYKGACEKAGGAEGEWCCPAWLRDGDGSFFHRESDGTIWRMYQFLPSDEEVPEDAKLPFEAGLGLGKLHRILDLCGSLEAVSTTAHLHSAPFYFAKYRTLEVTASGRIPELDALIEEQAEEMLETCEEPLRNIHGDAKVSNMLFREGRVTGVLDLDTLMQGSVYDDLADCARSCCVSGDGSVCPGRIEDLLSGYAEGYGKALPGDAYEKAVKSLERHRFLLGIRYYSDLLSGANAFPGLSETQKLEKARKNLENPVKSGKIILL